MGFNLEKYLNYSILRSLFLLPTTNYLLFYALLLDLTSYLFHQTLFILKHFFTIWYFYWLRR